MTSTVPAQLQAHLDLAATTTCRLLKIKGTDDWSPPLIFGLCSLDQDLIYDDGLGDGPIVYRSATGFDPAAMSSDLGFSVGNSESYGLLSDGTIDGVTEEMVRQGALDDGTWTCYLVNFNDLTTGRHFIFDAGDLGQVRIKYDTLWMPELLSYAMRLKQPIGGVWSRTCRAVYGEPTLDEGGVIIESQTSCGVDLSLLWVSGSVSSVGSETDRQFTGTAVATLPATNYPGRLQFLSGANAGKEYAVEDVTGLVVSLFEPTHYAIQIGDTYRIRRDCAKRYAEDCIALNANGLNFKGEPNIPVGDAAQAQTPNAQTPGGGFRSRIPEEET